MRAACLSPVIIQHATSDKTMKNSNTLVPIYNWQYLKTMKNSNTLDAPGSMYAAENSGPK
jgi:hypothetical protein